MVKCPILMTNRPEQGPPRVDVQNLEQHITTRQTGCTPVFPRTIQAVQNLLELYKVIGKMTQTQTIEASRPYLEAEERDQLVEATQPLIEIKQVLARHLISVGQAEPVQRIEENLDLPLRSEEQKPRAPIQPRGRWPEDNVG